MIEVQFKNRRFQMYSDNKLSDPVQLGDLVIVEADRGVDLGRIFRLNAKCKGCKDKEFKSVLRKATQQEISDRDNLAEKERDAFNTCLEKIEYHKLDMKLIEVEYQFDGNKVTFYFTAEQRVDFRSLVKDLASHFRTRIELRQIGVRDEAKRIGDIGICGQPLCCRTFLKRFETISLKMARNQQLPLNPAKISGCCGRLMCCIEYEDKAYTDALKDFPPLNTLAEIDKFTGRVLYIDIFGKDITLRSEYGNFHHVKLDEFNEKAKILELGSDDSDESDKELSELEDKGDN